MLPEELATLLVPLTSELDDDAPWMKHNGVQIPVAPATELIVRYRNRTLSQTICAGQRRWEAWPQPLGESAFDIVEWRLARPEKR